MASTSRIEISLEALHHNVSFIQSLVEGGTIISAVVKGNAYGHGISVVIPALEDMGIRHFAVYSSPEAVEADRFTSRESTIMVMGYIDYRDLDWILKNGVEFYVSNTILLEKAIERARQLKNKALVHLELETGMYRTGLVLSDLKKVIGMIQNNREYLTIQGVTSHFAGAESIANHTRIRKQFSIFNKRIKLLNDQGIHPVIKHIASSAAAINYPDTRLDMIRTGIMLYGYWPTRETFINYVHRRKEKSDPLKRALSWYSEAIHIKSVPEGEFIGYGLSYQASHNMKIMVVPVGYSNGYSRSMSNNGHVIVKGQRSPVIGTVNMNMIICDITDIPAVKIGEKITLIGEQGDARISFSSFAEMNNSLNYEILARLPENIERQLTTSSNQWHLSHSMQRS